MSSTRHAAAGAPYAQNKHAADPQYREMWPINGTAVSMKASIQASPAKRELLFFLQAMSAQPDGLKGFVRRFISEYADRIGSATMHRAALRPGQTYNRALSEKIRDEIYSCGKRADVDGWLAARREFPLSGEEVEPIDTPGSFPSGYIAGQFLERCQALADEHLADFIIGFCTDPNLAFGNPGERHATTVSYFQDIVGALYEFKAQYEKAELERFAMTSIARKVFNALDEALAIGKLAVIEGCQGRGKTEAVKAWYRAHMGVARYFDLSGINNQRDFFRAMARSCGIACGESFTCEQLRNRCEDFAHRSGLIFIIDEAHFLWPQGPRARCAPELVNWIDTMLYNRGVAAVLVTTPQFSTDMQNAAERTGWNSGQFKRRVKRWFVLPENVDRSDLMNVADKSFAEMANSAKKLLVGFAGKQDSGHRLDTLIDTGVEARRRARAGGRESINYDDVAASIHEVIGPTAAAKATAFGDERPRETKPSKPMKGICKPLRAGVPRSAIREVEPEPMEEARC